MLLAVGQCNFNTTLLVYLPALAVGLHFWLGSLGMPRPYYGTQRFYSIATQVEITQGNLTTYHISRITYRNVIRSRVDTKGFDRLRFPQKIARYTMISHKRDAANPYNKQGYAYV